MYFALAYAKESGEGKGRVIVLSGVSSVCNHTGD